MTAQTLLDEFDYLNAGNETSARAARVCREVNKFFRDRHNDLQARLTLGFGVMEICIGDELVWSTELDSVDDLTSGHLLGEYEAHCRRQLKLFAPTD